MFQALSATVAERLALIWHSLSHYGGGPPDSVFTLLRREIPDGDPAVEFGVLLEALVGELERARRVQRFFDELDLRRCRTLAGYLNGSVPAGTPEPVGEILLHVAGLYSKVGAALTTLPYGKLMARSVLEPADSGRGLEQGHASLTPTIVICGPGQATCAAAARVFEAVTDWTAELVPVLALETIVAELERRQLAGPATCLLLTAGGVWATEDDALQDALVARLSPGWSVVAAAPLNLMWAVAEVYRRVAASSLRQ